MRVRRVGTPPAAVAVNSRYAATMGAPGGTCPASAPNTSSKRSSHWTPPSTSDATSGVSGGPLPSGAAAAMTRASGVPTP